MSLKETRAKALCSEAICLACADRGAERVETFQDAHHARRACCGKRVFHARQVSLTSASGCATMVANMIPLMMTDQAVSQ
jgi:hypothetical protein